MVSGRYSPGMEGFADRLTFVMKALSLSRSRLAAELGVDKSVVSRWFAGARAPTAHNLAEITALVAARAPGFNVLDWDLPIEALTQRLGIGGPAQAVDLEEALTFGFVKRSAAETEALGARYVGLWRCTNNAFSSLDKVMRQHLLVFPAAGGRLAVRLFSERYDWPGWLLMTNQRLDILVEDFDLVHMMLAPPRAPFIHVMDGLVMTAAADEFMTPTAAVIHLERISPVGAEAETVAGLVEEARRMPLLVDRATLDPVLSAHLTPDVGPKAHAEGGDLVLRVSRERTLGRGGFFE